MYGGMRDHPPLHEQIHNGVEKRIYDKEILDNYTDEEIEKVNSFIDHERDFLFTYAWSSSGN